MAFSKGYRVLEGKMSMRYINNDDASRTENGQILTLAFGSCELIKYRAVGMH